MKKVKTRWVLDLPQGVEVLVKKGAEVETGEVLARLAVAEEKIVNLTVDLSKIKDNLTGKKVKKGEILGESGKFFKRKIISPVEGEISKIDEYNNVYFKLPGETIKKIVSPTEAEVVEVAEDSITLEFTALEFGGEGQAEGRAWGKNGIKVVEKVVDLSVVDEGKIMMASLLTPTMLAKAEVVGIAGVIMINGDRINSRLPILKMETEEFNNVLGRVGEVKRAMINANNGRLLLIV